MRHCTAPQRRFSGAEKVMPAQKSRIDSRSTQNLGHAIRTKQSFHALDPGLKTLRRQG
jgi:hypothetical protein